MCENKKCLKPPPSFGEVSVRPGVIGFPILLFGVSNVHTWNLTWKTAPTSFKNTNSPQEKRLDKMGVFWPHKSWETCFKQKSEKKHIFPKPIPSMNGIFNYIWLISMVHVGKYAIHGSYGKYCSDSWEKKHKWLKTCTVSILPWTFCRLA